jgi:hypothetical protein
MQRGNNDKLMHAAEFTATATTLLMCKTLNQSCFPSLPQSPLIYGDHSV